MSRPLTLSLCYMCIYIVIFVKVVTYLHLYCKWHLKTLCPEIVKNQAGTVAPSEDRRRQWYQLGPKSGINIYTWNFGMYDTSAER